MNGLFKEKVTRVMPFTHEVKKVDKGTSEHKLNPGHWQINKEMSKGLYEDFRIKSDKYGVSEVDYSDTSGSRYHLKRIKLVFPKEDKRLYYLKRSKDSSLTKGQREFAKKRLNDL